MFTPYAPFPQPSGERADAAPTPILAITSWGATYLRTARIVTGIISSLMILGSLVFMVSYLVITSGELRTGEEMMSFLFAVAVNVFLSFGLFAMSIFGYPALFQRKAKLILDGETLSLKTYGFLGKPIHETLHLRAPFSLTRVHLGAPKRGASALRITQDTVELLLCNDETPRGSGVNSTRVSRFSSIGRRSWAAGIWLKNSDFQPLDALLLHAHGEKNAEATAPTQP